MNAAPFPGADRAAFIARVSTALGRVAALAPVAAAPVVDESIARVTGAGEDLAVVFAIRAAEVGMVVHRTTANSANDRVLGLLADLGARRVAVGDGPLLTDVTAALSARGITSVAWRDTPGFEPLYAADAGVTDVQAAIAETGTLVCWSGPGRGRGLSLVPPIHIAVVRRSDIIPDLVDYWTPNAQDSTHAAPSSVVFITGPSKTADIEGVLITGVHGPREVHIVLIDDA